MAEVGQHLHKALHNLEFLNSLGDYDCQGDPDCEQAYLDDADWRITVMFYIAVHLYRARFAQQHLWVLSDDDPVHGRATYDNFRGTSLLVLGLPETQVLMPMFERMKVLSQQARYEVLSSDEYAAAEQSMQGYLHAFWRALQRKLQLPELEL